MMVFIDEGGHFTENAGTSVLCALSIPSAAVDKLRHELTVFTRNWPRKDSELKGGLVTPLKLAALVGVLYRHDALLHCIACDVSRDDQGAISRHKQRQAEGITKHLPDDYAPAVKAEILGLRKTVEQLPNQLYVQYVLLSDLVMQAAEQSAMYFAQRTPEELGQYDWVMDAKDPKRITTAEKWWKDTIGPLGESRSRQRPFMKVDDPNFDYRHFIQNFEFEKDLWWPDRPRERIRGIDIKKLITDRVTFPDSRSDILLQAVDVLANFMRRVLIGEIADEDVFRYLGRLQLLRRQNDRLQCFEMAAFQDQPTSRPGLGRISSSMAKTARIMPALKR